MKVLPAVCLFLAATASVHAQSYPSKAIVMVVPLQAASAADVTLRVVAQKMSESMGQQIAIDNQTGAAGMIGAERVARAAPDGYVIGGFADSIMTFAPNLYQKVAYDPLTSFDPVSMVAGVPWVMVVHPSVPAKNVREFIALAKANPGTLDYSSGGNGSAQHVATELFKSVSGISLTHIPYRGATQAALDVVSGRIPVTLGGVSVMLPFIKQGKLRPLATLGENRSTLLPDVPTASESGAPGYTMSTWIAIYVPHGTPKAVISRLNSEIVKAVGDPAVRDRLVALGLDPASSTPEQLAEDTRNGFAKMGKVIRAAGIKAE
jgi:tripartite-type tricarboxylate transporter receptor subunit TctC